MIDDPQIWNDARAALPLPKLLEALGDGRHLGKKAECPFCGKGKGKWGVFKDDTRGGRDFFKCHSPECIANNPEGGNSEIGYLMLRRGLPYKEACVEFLKLAVPERVPHLFESARPKAGEPPPRPKPEPRDGPPKNVWHALWKKLPLTSEDHAKLMAKRGFSPETIRIHGIRSNNISNKPLVESLEEQYSISVLLDEGIYKEEERKRAHPSGQFFGYGITGEKDPETKKAIFGITEPPIIPYFDSAGIPIYLRPHKGGVKRPKEEEIELFEDEDDGRTCASHVFVPIGFAALVAQWEGLAVLTEGEFKAIAGTQCDIPIIACPGISFVANPEFRRKLIDVLESAGVTDLVIIFDHEIKDDPKYTQRYKPDPENQCDTEMYAEYTMRVLKPWIAQRNGTCRVGQLPVEHMVDGKADFDGILALCVGRGGLEAGTREARRIFKDTIDNASAAPSADLFPSKKRRIIECKLERRFHTPRLPVGDKRELALAKRFRLFDPALGQSVDQQLAEAMQSVIGCYYLRKIPEKDERKAILTTIGDSIKGSGIKGQIAELEEKLKAIDAPQRHAKSDAPNVVAFKQTWGEPDPDQSSDKKPDPPQTAAQIRAHIKVLYSRLAAQWERLKGIPEAISTFTFTCEYKLHNADGQVDRLVRMHRQRSGKKVSESKLRRIAAVDLARLNNFREWCLGVGDAVFGGSGGGGEKDLQDLCIDADHFSYLRDIHELDTFGLHQESNIWFFADGAYPPSGPPIHADKSNIFWHDGTGYQITVAGSEDAAEAFCQKAPRLLTPHDARAKATNPAWLKRIREALIEADAPKEHREAIELADQMLANKISPDCDKLIESAPNTARDKLREALTASVFDQASDDFFNTIGDYDGWTAIGLTLAYAIGPELTRQGGHPGVWLTGKMSSGKTTIGRWLMRFWGFPELGGIKLGAKSSSAVGLNRGLTQYSSLPLLLDEYRRDTIDPEKEEALRGAFDRSGGLKGIADHSKKTRNPTAKTTPIVMGESSSGDGATRSRYAQIHVSLNKRIGDGAARYVRMQQDCKHYYLIGRWLMENRAAYAEAALETLAMWMQSDTVRQHIHNDRVRLVYGTAYACYRTAAALLGTLTAARDIEFQNFLMKHGEQGLADVVEETFLARFWADVITMRQRNKDSGGYMELRWVKIEADGSLTPAKANLPDKTADPSAKQVCYIGYQPLFDAYQIHKRTRAEDVQLSLGDVRREMETEPYWIPLPKSATERCHRIRMHGTKTACWVINLERIDGDGPEEERPFICPFAEDLINVLTPEKTQDSGVTGVD